MQYKNLVIKWGGHSGFLFKYRGMNIFIDPFRLMDESSMYKADLILITHGHYDHCSIEDLKKIIKPGTKIIGPSEILSQIRQLGDLIDYEIGEPGKKIEFNDILIDCLASYNLEKHFHAKEENYLSYLINFEGITVYHTGDSDFINEMKELNPEVFLVPIDSKFTMDIDEALRATKTLSPRLAIPMHWGSLSATREDAEKFVNGCRDLGIEASVLEKEI